MFTETRPNTLKIDTKKSPEAADNSVIKLFGKEKGRQPLTIKVRRSQGSNDIVVLTRI
jgi:hypothetical protein